MDRRTLATGVAILASLGAVLSAGCGAESVTPSTGARRASRSAAEETQLRAVVVNRALAPHGADVPLEPADTQGLEEVESTPLEEIASGAPGAAESPVGDVAAPAPAEEVDAQPHPQELASPSEALASVPAVARLEPAAEVSLMGVKAAAQSEIRFAVPSTRFPAAAEPARGKASKGRHSKGDVALGDGSARRAKSGLMPLVVTPREMPRRELASDQNSSAADRLPVAQQRVAERPVVLEPAAQRPATEQPVARPPVIQEPAAQEPVTREPTIEEPTIEESAVEEPAVEEPDAQQHSVRQLIARPPLASTLAPPTPLPPVTTARSPWMIAALARADERVRHGIELAEKGALYASRKEFMTAIRLIAQANDIEHGTRRYSRAAIAGFLALKEANDFVNQNAALGELDVARLVSGHKTPVLKDAGVEDMPPTIAAQYYFGYAKDQLAEGVGREAVGSIALYGLGRIIIAGAGPNSQQLDYAGPAMALYQAALIAEPQNFRAAHELGVLLVGTGQLELARAMLMGSAAVAPPQSMIWRNLAVVHSRLGEPQLAQEAKQKAEAMQQQSGPPSTSPRVEWVDPATFASTVPATDSLTPPAAVPPAESSPAKAEREPTKSPRSALRKRITEWDPLNLRR